MELALIFMGLLIFSAHVFDAFFEKTRIPSVLILITIGLVLGPLLGWVSTDDLGKAGSVFTTITLIAILYQSGTDLRIADLGKAIGGAAYLAVVNFVIALIIGLGIGYMMLDLNVVQSLFLGAATGGSVSATVVIPMIQQLKVGEKAKSILSLESALSDVVCLVVALALFDAMQSGDLHVGSMIGQIFTSLIFATLIGGIVGLGWIILHRNFLANLKNTMFTTFALTFILYGICEEMGFNGAIAALAFGIVVGNMGELSLLMNKYIPSERYLKSQKDAFLKSDERNFTSEIVFVLQTYFYVYVGFSLQLNDSMLLLIGLLFVVLVFITRVPVVKLMARKKNENADTGFSKRDLSLMSIMGPKGLVSAVLGSLPLQAAIAEGHLPGSRELEIAEHIQGIAYAGILFSIILCSILVFIIEKKSKKDAALNAESVVENENTESNIADEFGKSIESDITEE